MLKPFLPCLANARAGAAAIILKPAVRKAVGAEEDNNTRFLIHNSQAAHFKEAVRIGILVGGLVTLSLPRDAGKSVLKCSLRSLGNCHGLKDPLHN